MDSAEKSETKAGPGMLIPESTLTFPLGTVSATAFSESARLVPSRPGANYARFLEHRGERIFEVNGTLWGHHKGPFATSLPINSCLEPSPEEINQVLREGSVLGLRFPSMTLPGLKRGMYLVRPDGYGLRSVDRKQRSHVQTGLQACGIRNLDSDELADLGMPLNQDTLARQGRAASMFLDPIQWKRFVHTVGECPGMAIHGAFVKGKLATYIISCRDGEWLHLLYKMSLSTYRDFHPDHALDFAIIMAAGQDHQIQAISNGCEALLPNPGLDRYKRQLGYLPDSRNLCIHFHPGLAPLLTNRITLFTARTAHAWMPKLESLAYGVQVLEGASMARPGRRLT